MNHRRLVLIAGVLGVIVVASASLSAYLGLRASATTAAALPPPTFIDETASAGLSFTYDGDARFATGGGLAVLDCNGDGRPDLFLAGGAGPAALYRNDSVASGPLHFTRLPSPTTDLVGVNGAYAIDIDGDGHADLVLLTMHGAVILRGHGDCTFERANEALGFDGGNGWTSAFSASWENPNARLPTLAFGNYVGLDAAGNATYTCPDNELFRPDASGSGYSSAIPLSPGYCTLSMLFSDWDRSGRRDLRVANDRHYYANLNGEEQLWRIAAGAPPRLYTANDGWVQLRIWGMGIASYDVTGDGYPDVYLTSQADNKLQTLASGAAQPTYRDIALQRGVLATRPATGGDPLPSTAWHPEFQDVNNDGFIDLFVSKGNIDAVPDSASKDPSDLLLGQAPGTFVEGAGAAGIVRFERGRGAALADFNADGMLDLVEVFYGASTRLWRNVGAGDAAHPAAMGNWLAISLAQDGANRNAIGAWIEVQAGDLVIRRELTVGGGHISGQLGPIHVGIGQAGTAKVRVLWPDGVQGPWQQVPANQFTLIAKGGTPLSSAQPTGN